MKSKPSSIPKQIELTLLHPTITIQDIECLCFRCKAGGYKGVCVPPAFVSLIGGRDIEIITTVGHPFGYDCFCKKTMDFAVNANIYDITMDLAPLKRGRYLGALHQLSRLVHHTDKRVRVDIQSEHLTPIERTTAMQIVEDSGADGVILRPGLRPQVVETFLDIKITPIAAKFDRFPKANVFGVIFREKLI